jgi:subtilisin family serine protease
MRSFGHFLCIAAAAVAVVLPLAAQTNVPIRLDGFVRIFPGQQRADGFTTLGSLHSYHVTSNDYLANTVIVKTRRCFDLGKEARAFPSAELTAILRPYNVQSIRAPFPDFAPRQLSGTDRYGLGRIYEVTFDAQASVVELCDRLAGCGDVEYAEPVFIRHVCGSPNDPQLAQQYALAKVQAELAWEIGQGDTTVTIAIVDSGVDIDHEDLAANIWTNPKEIPGNNIDDDKNGKVDDVHGWDFVGNVSAQLAIANQFREDNNPKIDSILPPSDGRHHGTHVAGAAAAVTNNGKGVAGMGYRSRLIPVKVGSDAVQGNIYRGYDAIMYAAKLGANVIGCSWAGGPYSKTEEDVIRQATDMGSLVVAAAGNDGNNNDNFRSYPATYPGVLSVGASDTLDRSASFSNYGILTTAFAPGVKILSTISGNNRYDGNWSGTSMATPLVSGLAALLKALHPDWIPGQIEHQIRSTVDNVVVSDSLHRPLYYGRVNALRALTMNRVAGDSNAVPGVGVVASAVNATGGIITDNTTKQLRLTLRNYLGDARNLRVTVTALDNDVTVTGGSFTIDTLAHLAEKEIELGVQVQPNSAWFQGTASLMVRYESGAYVDYDLVQIPYQFPSADKYTMVLTGLPGSTIARGGNSPSINVLWAVGEVPGLGGGFIRYTNGSVNYSIVSPNALSTIYAFDANRAFTASGPKILNTKNGGTSWKDTTLATISNSLQHIHFFATTGGIVIGNPLAGKWGIGTTADGGTSWSAAAGAPAANDTNERLTDNSAAWRGDNGWFGTSEGRVLRTSDRGTTWSDATVGSGISITQLAFTSAQQGLALYRTAGDSSAPYHVAATTDGGATWTTNVFDLSTIGVAPVHLATPANSAAYMLMGSDGRILISKDNGASWIGAPTYKTNGVISAGATLADTSKVRVWNLGTAVGFVDIPFSVVSSVSENRAEVGDGLRIAALYPNPARDEIVVELALAKPSEVEITLVNALGQTVLRKAMMHVEEGHTTITLDTRSLAAGTYFCNVNGGGHSQSERLTIQR